MLEQLERFLQMIGVRRSPRQYHLRVVEYYDFDGRNLNEWCLLHGVPGSTKYDTWLYVVDDKEKLDKELVILSSRPEFQGHWVWLDLGTHEEEWTGIVQSSAKRIKRRNSQVWVSDVVADLVREDWVKSSCLTKLEWHRSMRRSEE